MPTKAHYPFSCATSAQYSTHDKTLPPPPTPTAEQPTWQQAWKEQLTWGEEEVLRVPKDTNGARPCHVRQDIHDGEGPAEDAKAQARHCHMANKHLPSTSMPHGKQTHAINVTWQTNTCCQHHCHMANACHQHHCHMANKHLPWTSLPHGKQKHQPSTSLQHGKHTPAINTNATWQTQPAINITVTRQTNTCHQHHCHMAKKHLLSTPLPHGKQTPAINFIATWQPNNCHQHHCHMANTCQQQHYCMANKNLPSTSLSHGKANTLLSTSKYTLILKIKSNPTNGETMYNTQTNNNKWQLPVSVSVCKIIIRKPNPTPPFCAYRKPWCVCWKYPVASRALPLRPDSLSADHHPLFCGQYKKQVKTTCGQTVIYFSVVSTKKRKKKKEEVKNTCGQTVNLKTSHSSGAVWELKWLSWAVHPNLWFLWK